MKILIILLHLTFCTRKNKTPATKQGTTKRGTVKSNNGSQSVKIQADNSTIKQKINSFIIKNFYHDKNNQENGSQTDKSDGNVPVDDKNKNCVLKNKEKQQSICNYFVKTSKESTSNSTLQNENNSLDGVEMHSDVNNSIGNGNDNVIANPSNDRSSSEANSTQQFLKDNDSGTEQNEDNTIENITLNLTMDKSNQSNATVNSPDSMCTNTNKRKNESNNEFNNKYGKKSNIGIQTDILSNPLLSDFSGLVYANQITNLTINVYKNEKKI